MIEMTVTAASREQAEQLLDLPVDYLYLGDREYGLRLPTHFSQSELAELIELVHQKGKKVSVAVNAIMHPEKMATVLDYLFFLQEHQVDRIVVGDPGVIYLIRKHQLDLPYVYDGATLVTSSRQINFWGKKGAEGAVIAREVPYQELKKMSGQLAVFGEVLVYGATCIHHSKRPLVRNYFSYIGAEEDVGKERGLFLSEPKDEDTHYSIYEDHHGTHIFASNDVNLMMELGKLYDLGYTHWKLDGIYTPGDEFVRIAGLFAEAKRLLEQGMWSQEKAAALTAKVRHYHPQQRGLDQGFFYLDPDEIK